MALIAISVMGRLFVFLFNSFIIMQLLNIHTSFWSLHVSTIKFLHWQFTRREFL